MVVPQPGHHHLRIDVEVTIMATQATSRRIRKKLKTPLMLAPALLIVVLLFGGGILVGLGESLGYFPAIGLRTFTFEYYVSVLSDPNFAISLWLTFRIAAITTVLSAIFAIAFALVLREKFWGSRLSTFLYQVPLPVPHLVAASGVILLFTQSGLIARLAASIGLITTPGDFPALVFDKPGVAIILTFLWKEIPFVGLVVLAILQSVGPQFEEQARTLGANSRQRFRYVLLPLIMPGVMATSIIIFAFTFANYEIPLLLGVRFPTTLPVVSFRLYQDTDLALRPEAMAISMVLAVVALLLLIAYRRLAQYAVR